MKEIIFSILVLIFILVIMSIGLNKKMANIRSKFCLGVFLLAVLFSIYTVGYAGEQGAVGLLFVPFIIAFPCILFTVVLLVIQYFEEKKKALKN